MEGTCKWSMRNILKHHRWHKLSTCSFALKQFHRVVCFLCILTSLSVKLIIFFIQNFQSWFSSKVFSQSWFTCLLQSDGSKLRSGEQSELSYPSTPQSQRSNRWIVLDHLSSNQKTMKDLSTIWQMDTWTYLETWRPHVYFLSCSQ